MNNSKFQAQQRPVTSAPLTLHQWVTILYGIVTFCLAIAGIFVVGNGLDNFLHAPIGIKDNPPEPGAVVQIAQFVVGPLALCWVALKVIKFFTATYPAREVLLGIGAFVLWVVLMVLLVGEVFHREFIPGTRYFWREIAPRLFVAGPLSFDGLMAYVHIKDWKDKANRLAGVFFGLSTGCGIAGMIRWVPEQGGGSSFLVAFAVVFFVVGFLAAPKVPQSTTVPKPPA